MEPPDQVTGHILMADCMGGEKSSICSVANSTEALGETGLDVEYDMRATDVASRSIDRQLQIVHAYGRTLAVLQLA